MMLVLVTCLGVGEIFVRLLFADKIVLFPRFQTDAAYDGFTLRRLRPGATFHHTSVDGTWEFRINAQGFRDDRDYDYAKPLDTIRVISLGDSQTQGFEVRQEHTFSEVVERALVRSGHRAEVLNTGVSGFSTAEQLAFLESEGLKYRPDVVLLGVYANDFDDNIKAGLYEVEGVRLVVRKTWHLPGVRTLNLLHAVPLTGWLSQNSYLYSLALNTAWNVAKARLLSRAEAELATEYAISNEDVTEAKKDLMRKLVERLYRTCRDNRVRVVVLDVPQYAGRGKFESSIPDDLRHVFVAQSDAFIDSRLVLGAYEGITDLHVPHGQHHISELSHLMLGLAAAEAIGMTLSSGQGGGIYQER
jgi:lysophospholipase L1-like esterase